MTKLALSSIAEIKSLVGQDVVTGEWFTVDQPRINLFAQATGDMQWIHVDEVRCTQESPFGTTIAHGFLTLSLIPHLMESVLIYPGVKMGVNYGLNSVRFTSPVRSNSRVRVKAHLLDVKDIQGGAQVFWKITLELENSDKPACVAETISLIYF